MQTYTKYTFYKLFYADLKTKMALFLRQIIHNSGGAEVRKQSRTFCKDVSHKLNEYRQQNQMCDVILVAGERLNQLEFPAHRGVLSAGSLFFEGLFTSGMREEKEQKVKISQIQPSILEHVLNYLYTGEVNLTKENGEEILKAADFFMIEGLKMMACDVFELQLDMSNCVSVFILADTYSCDELKDQALRVVQEHFEEISKTEPFLTLTFDQLNQILSQKYFKAGKQETLFEALVNWVWHDLAREKFFPELFSHIQLTSIDDEFLQSKITSEDLVQRNDKCAQLVKERQQRDDEFSATIDVLLQYQEKNLVTEDGDVLYSTKINGVYYSPGNPLRYEKQSIEGDISYWQADPHEREEIKYWDPPVMLSHKDYLYVLPFYMEFHQRQIKFARYNPSTDTLTVLPPPPVQLQNHTGAVLNDCIYMVGAPKNPTDDDLFPTMQRYDISKGVWKEVAHPSHGIIGHTVVSDGNYLYALGGCDVDPEVETDAVEKYDPKTNSWSLLPPVGNYGKVKPLAVAVDGYIFVTGGSNCNPSTGSPNSTLIYSPISNSWFNVTSYMIKKLDSKFRIDTIFKFENKVHLYCKECSTSKYSILHWGVGCQDWHIESAVPPYVNIRKEDSFKASLLGPVTVTREFLQVCIITDSHKEELHLFNLVTKVEEEKGHGPIIWV